MADFCDHAAELEAIQRAEAIARVLERPAGPGPVFIGGVACCRGCGAPIVSRRLRLLPGVGVCVLCAQEEQEGLHR